MSELRDRIAAVLCAHPDRMDGKCHGTGKPFEHQDEWAAHVADAVIAELGLTRESPQLCDGGTHRHRYVTHWKDSNDG